MSSPGLNPDQQEVWKTLRALNDAWTKGNPEKLKQYFHENIVAITPTDRERLKGREASFGAWNKFVQSTKILEWKEIDPIVQVYGNAAVVTYNFEISYEIGRTTAYQSGRDMFVFVREQGRWWAVAAQFSWFPQ